MAAKNIRVRQMPGNEDIDHVAPGLKEFQGPNDNKTCEDAASDDRINGQDIHVAN
jgi:hypothetical protein